MFGKKEQTLADEQAVKEELQRLQSSPIEQVAAEVTTRTFAPSRADCRRRDPGQ